MDTTVQAYDLKLKVLSFECEAGIEKYLGHIFRGEYDVPVSLKAPRILDIGANLGAFSIWAYHRWPGSQIYAYEPNAELLPILKRNLAVNTASSVTVLEHAVGNPGVRTFYKGDRNCGEGSLYTNIAKPGVEVKVESPLTLPEANVLKVDTEGCEVEIIEPLLKDGRKFDVILFEYHRENDRTLLDVMLEDYILMGATVYAPARGVMKYMHKSILNLGAQ